MKLGKKALEALQAEIDGQLKPGDELIVAGPVAAEGTGWDGRMGKVRHGLQRTTMTDCGKFFRNGSLKMPENFRKFTEQE